MKAQASDETRGPLRYAGRVVAFALAAGLVALLAYGLLARAPDTTIDDALANATPVPAPGFSLEPLIAGSRPASLAFARAQADDRVDLRELRGTPIVLNFWASWCIPCREEAPLLQRGWIRHANAGVLFLGLNMQDVRSDARTFVRAFKQTFPHVRDPTNATARKWGVTGIPETFFIGRDGRIVGHVIGVVTVQQLARGIADAMAGRAQNAALGGDRRPTR
ncbi:MAG: TlpA family protein disulfide reductase [Solirubrobacteraceae bacterium]